MTYQQYRRIADLLILHTRRVEESRTASASAVDSETSSEQSAIRKSQLVNWYLEEVASETLHSEAELVECKLLVERIIDRLVKKVRAIFCSTLPFFSNDLALVHLVINFASIQDNVLIALSRSGLDAGENDEDPYLVVHPNYSTD